MVTPYGIQVRKHRLDKGVRLSDMAEALGLSPAYVSATETVHGKKRPTDKLIRNTAAYFGLDEKQTEQLYRLAGRSHPKRIQVLEAIAEKSKAYLAEPTLDLKEELEQLTATL